MNKQVIRKSYNPAQLRDVNLRREVVVSLMAEGLDSWEIAKQLGVPDKVIADDYSFLEKQISRAHDSLKLRNQVDSITKDYIKEYKDEDDPSIKQAWGKLINDILKIKASILKDKDIIFLQQNIQNNTKVDIYESVKALVDGTVQIDTDKIKKRPARKGKKKKASD